MSINHIDQLTEWWENAEEGVVQKGDTVIEYLNDGHHAVYVADWDQDQIYGFYRILARAPKPKPAWHDAVAVVATVPNEYGEDERGVWIPGSHGMWEDDMGRMFDSADLSDVTPLIEAKVTDEMAKRLVARWNHVKPGQVMGIDYAHDVERARADLTAALGLETT